MNDRLEGQDAQNAVKEWLARNPIVFDVIEDPKSTTSPVTIVERLSGKTLSFPWAAIRLAELRQLPGSGTPFYKLDLDDGRSFAVSGLGFIFEPSFVSTGPVPDTPGSACFLDYQKLLRHFEHLAQDGHEEHQREALQVLMVLLSFLDGAREIGLDVSDEEQHLEPILTRLESRR
jgi:hypothetical protein